MGLYKLKACSFKLKTPIIFGKIAKSKLTRTYGQRKEPNLSTFFSVRVQSSPMPCHITRGTGPTACEATKHARRSATNIFLRPAARARQALLLVSSSEL